MPGDKAPIELSQNDLNRVWQLTLHMYDEDEHVTDVFVAAMQVYREFMADLAAGGGTFEDGENEWYSSFEGDKLLFKPRKKPEPPPKPEKGADKEKKKDKKKEKKG